MSAPGRREVAHRLFAAEYDDATLSYSESDEERAPNYVVTPTGARINRLFVVGVLIEKEAVNEDMIRARIVDPTGPFMVYAGQYQPEALAALERLDAPAFVAVTGKARTFSPEDSDRVFTSVRPESVAEVDAETRDRWTVVTAERTLERVATMAGAKLSGLSGDALGEALVDEGVSESLAAGVPLALDHYDTSEAYLAAVHDLAVDAARVVAGEIDEVAGLSLAPSEGGTADVAAFADPDVAALEGPEGAEPVEEPASAESPAEPESETEPPGDAVEETATGSAAEADAGPTPSTTAEADAGEEIQESAATPEATADQSPSPSGSTESPRAPEGDAEPDTGGPSADEEELGDFETGDFEMADETREEIESEFGTDFSTGNEVDPAGEAGIEPEGSPDGESPPEAETEATPAPTPEAEADDETEDGGDQPDDLESAVVDLMRELDDGDGAPTADIVAAAADRWGTDADAVEEAIQSALMSGQCYEPSDGSFKPI